MRFSPNTVDRPFLKNYMQSIGNSRLDLSITIIQTTEDIFDVLFFKNFIILYSNLIISDTSKAIFNDIIDFAKW